MIWLALAMLVLAAFIVVLPPLLKGAQVAAHAEGDFAVYRDQLKEVDLDQERGLISAAEADAARTEIKRRILALGSAATAQPNRATKAAKPLALAVTVAIAGISLATYLGLGRPGMPSRPYDAASEQRAMTEDLLRNVETMVAKLADRLSKHPNDPMGWRALGWAYLQLGRTNEGVAALKRAVALDAENGALRSLYGEALVRQANGKVTDEALAAFDEALKRDAKDPRARFYKGMALAQAGKDREALEIWVSIIRDGPADAEWLPAIRAQAQELAAKLKLDPEAAVP
jgi:cytochrome c-type biogenesis protein CcmH